MNRLISALALATGFALSGGALAQENSESTIAGDLSLGQSEATEVGQNYFKEASGDWALRCVKTEDGNDPCQMYQLLRDVDNTPTAEIALFKLPAGGQAVLGATIVTPLETLLTQQISLTVDDNAGKRYPFSWCTRSGCIARVGFTESDVDAFKKGNAAVMAIVPVANPAGTVDLTISLKGFTKSLEMIPQN